MTRASDKVGDSLCYWLDLTRKNIVGRGAGVITQDELAVLFVVHGPKTVVACNKTPPEGQVNVSKPPLNENPRRMGSKAAAAGTTPKRPAA